MLGWPPRTRQHFDCRAADACSTRQRFHSRPLDVKYAEGFDLVLAIADVLHYWKVFVDVEIRHAAKLVAYK